MSLQKREAHGLARIIGQQFVHQLDIAARFRHFFTGHVQHAIVQPVARQRRIMGAPALCAFVFMMGKLQIHAAAVNVNCRPEMMGDHGRTFDVPARTPPPPRAFPARQIVA